MGQTPPSRRNILLWSSTSMLGRCWTFSSRTILTDNQYQWSQPYLAGVLPSKALSFHRSWPTADFPLGRVRIVQKILFLKLLIALLYFSRLPKQNGSILLNENRLQMCKNGLWAGLGSSIPALHCGEIREEWCFPSKSFHFSALQFPCW